MSISEYLDVFIGLAFTYLILSLIVTAIFESISQFMRLRARNLERAIRKLLEGKLEVRVAKKDDNGDVVKDEAGKEVYVKKIEAIADNFYNHAIIKSLEREKPKT